MRSKTIPAASGAISPRQLVVFYFIYSFSIKFISLPSLLAKTAGSDAWLAAALGTAIELLLLFLTLLFITQRHVPRPPRAVKTVLLLFALCVFAYQLVLLFNHTYALLDHNLYDHIPYFLFIIPMAIFGLFFCLSPVRAIFRSAEIFFVFIVLGVAIAVIPAVTHISPTTIKAPLSNGVMPVIRAVFENIIYFESFLFILLLRPQIALDYRGTGFSARFKTKFMLLATALGVFFVFFVFMFQNLFGALAPMRPTAISNLTLHSSYATTSGRFDWALLTIWLLLILMRFGVTAYCAMQCLRPNNHAHAPKIASRALTIACLALVIALLPPALARGAQANQKTILTEIEITRTASEYTIVAAPLNDSAHISASAPSIPEALNKIALDTNKSVSLAHCTDIILKSGFENTNIAPTLEYFLNRSELNNNCQISYAAKGIDTPLEQFFKHHLSPPHTAALAVGNNKIALFVNGIYQKTIEYTDTAELLKDRQIMTN